MCDISDPLVTGNDCRVPLWPTYLHLAQFAGLSCTRIPVPFDRLTSWPRVNADPNQRRRWPAQTADLGVGPGRRGCVVSRSAEQRVLVHQYLRVDVDTIRVVMREHLPVLTAAFLVHLTEKLQRHLLPVFGRRVPLGDPGGSCRVCRHGTPVLAPSTRQMSHFPAESHTHALRLGFQAIWWVATSQVCDSNQAGPGRDLAPASYRLTGRRSAVSRPPPRDRSLATGDPRT